ncbi:DUF5610 domain-containing protein [Janthinobacterium fluminis]|uniref:DUF5610 domain-containing protein n=1 Tax=Janthinobacterium fluminis TaxID=2987524 RepID=A0ABT5JXB5_9BURK|nr:DUF5610 domain-containing protein [Janthinobacterium fluminis]MDC8757367.1 DUF5610 domain-containing protein [Janthinobacterium fluminis]
MSNSISIAASGKNAAELRGGPDKVKPRDVAAEMSPSAKAKLQQNAAILEASVSVSMGAENKPLTLLLKSAITSINETLRGEFGENAIENAAAQDNSAAATAGRIVSLSTGFFESYKKQHPGEDEDAALGKFMETIRGGFERGYKEAADILKGLNVFKGELAGEIDKTYQLVQKGYADFEAAHKKKPETDTKEPATPVKPG